MTIADSTRLGIASSLCPGTKKGVTPVVLAGYQTTYFPGQKAYEPAGDVAGIGGDYYWEQSYSAPFVAERYINQHLKADMNLLNASDSSFMPADVAKTLQEQGLHRRRGQPDRRAERAGSVPCTKLLDLV